MALLPRPFFIALSLGAEPGAGGLVVRLGERGRSGGCRRDIAGAFGFGRLDSDGAFGAVVAKAAAPAAVAAAISTAEATAAAGTTATVTTAAGASAAITTTTTAAGAGGGGPARGWLGRRAGPGRARSG